jgi:hypothetical protein
MVSNPDCQVSGPERFEFCDGQVKDRQSCLSFARSRRRDRQDCLSSTLKTNEVWTLRQPAPYLGHAGGSAETTASRAGGDGLETVRADPHRCCRRRFQEPLRQQKDNPGDDDEIEDGAEEMTVKDGISTAESQFCVTPAAARHEYADDRHQHVIGDCRDELASRRTDDHADSQRQRVGSSQKRSKFTDHARSRPDVGRTRNSEG